MFANLKDFRRQLAIANRACRKRYNAVAAAGRRDENQVTLRRACAAQMPAFVRLERALTAYVQLPRLTHREATGRALQVRRYAEQVVSVVRKGEVLPEYAGLLMPFHEKPMSDAMCLTPVEAQQYLQRGFTGKAITGAEFVAVLAHARVVEREATAARTQALAAALSNELSEETLELMAWAARRGVSLSQLVQFARDIRAGLLTVKG